MESPSGYHKQKTGADLDSFDHGDGHDSGELACYTGQREHVDAVGDEDAGGNGFHWSNGEGDAEEDAGEDVDETGEDERGGEGDCAVS